MLIELIFSIKSSLFMVSSLQEANRMASDAEKTIIDKLNDKKIPVPPINIETYREDRSMAVGNGSGIK